MSERRIGGYEWNAELNNIRNAANDILQSLQEMLSGNLGPQTILAHAAKMMTNVGKILNAVTKLEEFGDQAKDIRKTK